MHGQYHRVSSRTQTLPLRLEESVLSFVEAGLVVLFEQFV